jgi:hypothetical protein
MDFMCIFEDKYSLDFGTILQKSKNTLFIFMCKLA